MRVSLVSPTPPAGLPSEFTAEDCVSYRVGQTVEVMRDGAGPSHVILRSKRSLMAWALIASALMALIFVVFFVFAVVDAVYRQVFRAARS